VNRHHRLRQASVELAVPVRVTAQPGGHTQRDDLEDTAEGIPASLRIIDQFAHRRLRFGVDASQFGLFGDGRDVFPPWGPAADRHAADLGDVAGVVVATPTSTHAAVVAETLALGVPMFVEKPLTDDPESATTLAERAGNRLFVMDKWRYHPGIEALAAMARSAPRP